MILQIVSYSGFSTRAEAIRGRLQDPDQSESETEPLAAQIAKGEASKAEANELVKVSKKRLLWALRRYAVTLSSNGKERHPRRTDAADSAAEGK
jgi:hypothetical protein